MESAVCFTGHRPEKLYRAESAVKAALRKEILSAVTNGFTDFISGMARGTDLWAAELVLEMKKENPAVKLVCAVPYEGFEEKWPLAWRQLYREVRAAADEVKVFYPSFTYASFQQRNRWMVDHSARVVAVYGGGRGGTYNTLQYARRQGKEISLLQG